MSTRQQDEAGCPVLYHAELYTVVSDPPNEPMTVDRYRDPVDAQRVSETLNRVYQAKWKSTQKIAYVLPPQPTPVVH